VKSNSKLYKYHTTNLRSVRAGLDDVFSSAKSAIARKRTTSVPTHLRLYAFLLGAWAECRLLKLLYEPKAFTDAERSVVLCNKALDRWHTVLKIAYRRHYRVPKATLAPPALPVTAAERLRVLRSLLDDDLSSIITLRNKLAHGQWVYPLNDALDDVAQDQMDQLRKENLLTLKFKTAMIESLCACIHDLVVSRPTFERDFDTHFRHIEQLRIDTTTRDYSSWQRQLEANYERGQADFRKRILASTEKDNDSQDTL